MENQQLVSPSRTCCSTPVVLVKGFLAKSNVTTLDYPPYYPNLAESDFDLFLDWNQHLSEDTFVKQLTSLIMRWKSWKGFHKMAYRMFATHLQCWQTCIFAQVDRFEGNIAEMIVLLCISQKKNISGTFWSDRVLPETNIFIITPSTPCSFVYLVHGTELTTINSWTFQKQLLSVAL